MQTNQKGQNEFLNPYRENKRCFAKYFKNGQNLNRSLTKKTHENREGFLDNISRASSMKYKDESVQNYVQNKSHVESSLQNSQFVIIKKRKINELHNPEMFQLLSKHIERTESVIKKPKKTFLKSVNSLLSERIKIWSNSVHEFMKAPKITQFFRETFYRNTSSTGRQYSSKKQKQDIMHSNSNLDINARKQAICKKTRPYKDSRSFVTYELYNLNKRVGIDVQILAGALKQIKFRLIMNQSDTRTFHKCWNEKIDEFIDKCLVVNEDGISLKVGSFNVETGSKKKSTLIKHVQRVYLEQYEALVKNTKNKKVTKKIVNINFSQQYHPDQVQLTQQQQAIHQDLHIQSNSKEINSKDNQTNEKKLNEEELVKIENEKLEAQNEQIEEVNSKSHIKEDTEKQDQQMPNFENQVNIIE